MPERLSDIINVKDWGAKGDDSADDRPAIQSAIAEAIRRGGGRVLFPPGTYALKSSPYNLSVGSENPSIRVELTGIGPLSWIKGQNGPGTFLISKGASTYDNLARMDGLALDGGPSCSGLVKLEGEQQTLQRIMLGSIRVGIPNGGCGIDASAANGALIAEVDGGGPGGVPVNDPNHGVAPNTVGIYLGSGCVARDCRLQGGLDIFYALCGNAPALHCCQAEVGYTGIRVGWGPSGEATAYGFSVVSLQTEAMIYAVDLYNCQGGFISSVFLSGGASPYPSGAAIASVSYRSNTVTVNTAAPHNLPQGIYPLQLTDGVAAAWVPTYAVYNNRQIVATVGTNPTQFTYWLGADPGAPPSTTGWGWTIPMAYSFRLRKVQQVMIAGIHSGNNVAYADIDLDYDGQAQNHQNNAFYGYNFSAGVRLPQATGAPTRKNSILGGWQFFGVSGTQNKLDGYGGRDAHWTAAVPNGSLVFADLPGQSGFQAGPYEGQEFSITDSQIPNDAAHFGATVTTGGGNYTVKLRRIGSNWTISG
jgi:Pectate lyase superfamily protein